jgi:predicted transcriptional regulator
MKKSKPTIAELRTMSTKDLSKNYDIPNHALDRLRYGANPMLYPLIIDGSFSTDEIARLSNKKTDNIGHITAAMARYGYVETLKRKNRKTRKISEQKMEIIEILYERASTSKEIAETTGKSVQRVYTHIRDLKEVDIASSFRFSLKKRVRQDSLFKKLQELSGVDINYLSGLERTLGQRLVESLPELEKITPGHMRSLRLSLKNSPEDAFALVQEYVKK